MSDVLGIDVPTMTDWLVANVPDVSAPLDFRVIAGGHSNLTYGVTDANGRKLVVRRPPLGARLASAHDMGREHRIISGLQASAVPVPPALAYCDDPAVSDAPFYVMGFVDGYVVRDRETAEAALTPGARDHASASLIDTMVAMHAVDLEEAGLSTLGRHEGYVARQLKRWHGQTIEQRTRDLPVVDRVHDALAERIPEQRETTIVHGDYRLDNCIVADDGTVAAVLDWEICTLGDPLADLGLLMVYWTGPDDEQSAWTSGDATTAPGFWNRDRLARRYGERSGRDLGQLDFYVAFAYWKLACIVEGVYARYVAGALGNRDPRDFDEFARQVDEAATMAERRLESMP